MDLGLALPKAAVFMSGPEMRRAFRRVPPALRLRSGREIFKRPVREGGFAGRQEIEQNKNFVQLRGAKKRIFAEMSVLAWLAAKTSFVRIMGFYGSGSVKTLPVLLLYYRL